MFFLLTLKGSRGLTKYQQCVEVSMEISPPFFFLPGLPPSQDSNQRQGSQRSSESRAPGSGRPTSSPSLKENPEQGKAVTRLLLLFFFIDCDFRFLRISRVPKNKSMQHHTLSVGTAEMELCNYVKNRKLGFRGHVRSTKVAVHCERSCFAPVVSGFDKRSLLSLILIIGIICLPVVLYSFERR